MIDPLRPYWPTNRSIAGLLVRSFCLLAAATAVALGAPRLFLLIVVVLAAMGQAFFLVLQWMELKGTGRVGLIAASTLGFIFLSFVVVLLIESRAILVSSFR